MNKVIVLSMSEIAFVFCLGILFVLLAQTVQLQIAIFINRMKDEQRPFKYYVIKCGLKSLLLACVLFLFINILKLFN